MTKARAVTSAVMVSVMSVALLAGCSREKIDWKSAEAADTVEAYDRFLARHADGALAPQARARVAQLNEDRDWKRVTTTDTAEAYRQFLAQHDHGKWAEEARIRIENFALDGTATGPTAPAMDVPPVAGGGAAAAAPAAAAPSAVPTVPPAANSPSPGQFGIQLGAFRTQEAALNDWKRVQVKFDTELHGLFARAVPIQHSAGQLFRLQVPVGEEARARAICASLAKQSQPCVIVLPHPQ